MRRVWCPSQSRTFPTTPYLRTIRGNRRGMVKAHKTKTCAVFPISQALISPQFFLKHLGAMCKVVRRLVGLLP